MCGVLYVCGLRIGLEVLSGWRKILSIDDRKVHTLLGLVKNRSGALSRWWYGGKLFRSQSLLSVGAPPDHRGGGAMGPVDPPLGDYWSFIESKLWHPHKAVAERVHSCPIVHIKWRIFPMHCITVYIQTASMTDRRGDHKVPLGQSCIAWIRKVHPSFSVLHAIANDQQASRCNKE